MMVDLPNTLEIVVVSSADEAMEGFEGHPEEEDDLDEYQEIDEVVVEKQLEQEIDEVVMEQQVEQKADEVGLGVSDSSFDQVEESKDESDPNYNLSRDHQVVSGLHLSELHFEPCIIYGMVRLDSCILYRI